MSTQLTVANTESPVSVTALRRHCRVTDDDTTHDERLQELASRAVGWVEDYINRPLLRSTFVFRLHRFPGCEIELPVGPVVSVASVQYVDGAGTTQTWASSNYNVDNFHDLGRAKIRPVFGKTFPSTRGDFNDVVITFDAGWSTPENVPQPIIQAVLLIVGHYFSTTDAAVPQQLSEIPFGAKSLLGPYRNMRF